MKKPGVVASLLLVGFGGLAFAQDDADSWQWWAATSPPPLDVPPPSSGRVGLVTYGQSLSTGAFGGSALTTDQPYSNLMLDTDSSGFLALVEGSPYADVETGKASFANQIRRMAGSGVYIVSAQGSGGQPMSGLEQGTALYNTMITRITAQRTLTAAAGDTYSYGVTMFVHGESDDVAGNLSYQTELEALASNASTDINTVTGQTGTRPFLISQMSSRAASQNAARIAIQQKAAADAQAGIYLTQPKYQYPYVDRTHLTNVGYRWMMEKDGEVARRILAGEAWRPLEPDSIDAVGNLVDVDFHVPDPPCQWDTTNVIAAVDGNYGFEVSSATNGSLAISNTSLIDASACIVRLTLNATPPADTRIRYAYSGGAGYQGDPQSVNAPRGNLKDSDSEVYASGSDASNWAVHFDEPIDTFSAAPDGGVVVDAGSGGGACLATHSVDYSNDPGATISVADNDLWDPGTAGTWVLFVKQSATGNYNFWEHRGGTDGLWSIRALNGRVRFLAGSTSNDAQTSQTVLTNVGTGTWIGIAVTYDATNGYRIRTRAAGNTIEHTVNTTGSLPASITGGTTAVYLGSPNTVNQAPSAQITGAAYWQGVEASTAQLDELLAGPGDYSASLLGNPTLYYPHTAADSLTTAGGVDNAGSAGATGDGTGSDLLAGDLLADAPTGCSGSGATDAGVDAGVDAGPADAGGGSSYAVTHSIDFSRADNLYYTVADNDLWDLGTAATWVTWIKLSDNSGNESFVEHRGTSPGYWRLTLVSDDVRLFLGSNSNYVITNTNWIGAGQVDQWLGIVWVYNGTAGTAQIYTNVGGTISEQTVSTVGTIPASITGANTPIYIGSPNTVNQAPDARMAQPIAMWTGVAANATQAAEILATPLTDLDTVAIGSPVLWHNVTGASDITTAGGIVNLGTAGTAGDNNASNLASGDLVVDAP